MSAIYLENLKITTFKNTDYQTLIIIKGQKC